MTALVSADDHGEVVPDYWADDTFDADISDWTFGAGELWERIAEGRRRD